MREAEDAGGVEGEDGAGVVEGEGEKPLPNTGMRSFTDRTDSFCQPTSWRRPHAWDHTAPW